MKIQAQKERVQQNQCPLLGKSLEDELLKSRLYPQSVQSKLVHLELGTATEASEATLTYLCELAPVLMDTIVSLPGLFL